MKIELEFIVLTIRGLKHIVKPIKTMKDTIAPNKLKKLEEEKVKSLNRVQFEISC